MKGIKTAVTTEWKNLAHGNTRKYDFRSGEQIIINGIKPGDVLWLTYTCHWRFLKENIGSVIQTSNMKNKYPLALWTKGTPSADNVAHYRGEYKVEEGVNMLYIYSPKWDSQYGAVKDKDSYVIIENVMANIGDKPLPYIDSDELKAEGGVIVRFLSADIFSLAYAGRKEAA